MIELTTNIVDNNAIVVRKPRPGVANVIEALVFSFLIYAILAPCYGGSPVSMESVTLKNTTTYRPTVDAVFLVSAVVLAILLALIVGSSITNDLHMALLRKLRVTHRTARDDTWLDIFIDQKRYFVVTFTDGRRIFGWPQYYSNDRDEVPIYIYEPT